MLLVEEKYMLDENEIDFVADLLDVLGKFKDDTVAKKDYKKIINLETELRESSARILEEVKHTMYLNKIRSKEIGMLNKVILKLLKSSVL